MASCLLKVAMYVAVHLCCASVSADQYPGRASPTLEDICSHPPAPPSGSLDNQTLSLNSSRYTVASGSRCLVEDVQHLTIRGNPNTTTIECERGPGKITSTIFSFINVTALTVENVHFEGCGASLSGEDTKYLKNESLRRFGPGQAVVFLCNHCLDLTLVNVRFSNNTGYAFVGLNLRGKSLLDGVQVLGEDDEHRLPDDPLCNQTGLEYVCSGRGGVLLFGESNFDTNLPTMKVVLNNSVFDTNRSPLFNSSISGDVINQRKVCVGELFEDFLTPWSVKNFGPLYGVSALTIAHLQSSFKAHVSILSSNFTNNHGECFGAILVLFQTVSSDMGSQTIQGCTFVANSPVIIPRYDSKLYLGSDVTVYMQYREHVTSQCITITDSFFEDFNNSLESVSIAVANFPVTEGNCVVYLEDLQKNSSTKFLFVTGIVQSNTIEVFIKNLQISSAHLHQYNLKGFDQNDGLMVFISIANVTIHGTDEESCQFNHLLGPVVVSKSSTIYLTGELLFANIVASTWAYGAAILLQSGSTLWLQEPLRAKFSNNSAVMGGALSSTQVVDEFCVMQYYTNNIYTEQNISLLDISLTFSGNSARLAGNSLYFQSLYSCSIRLSSGIGPIDIRMLYNTTFHFENSIDNGLLEISSTPQEICLCKGDLTNTSQSALNCARDSLEVPEITTYPGKVFSVNILCVDGAHNPLYTILYNRLLPKVDDELYTDEEFDWELGFGQNIIKLYGYNCTRFNFSIHTKKEEHSTGILALYPYGIVDCLAIPIVLKECPPGFKLDVSIGICICDSLLSQNGFLCSIDRGTITKPNKFSWVGVVSRDKDHMENGSNSSSLILGYSGGCPIMYCSKTLEIASFAEVCAFNRVGALCGRCREGMSTVVGDIQCQRCSNLWLLTIPLYALVGVLLVSFLFLLRITVATGTVNGLIFFANTFNFNNALWYSASVWSRVFVSFLNLEMGFPLCLYDGLTTLVSTYMSFLVPLYLWLIVLVFIILSRHFQTISKLTSRSAVPVLATIFHLSFSKLLSLTVNGLSAVIMQVEDKGELSYRYVWYYDGSVLYLHGYHIGLFLLSVLSLVLFLIPYTVFLTGIKLFSRYKLVNRVRPFVDAFCAPYKDKWRFWFGARLWVLIILYISYASLQNSPDIVYLLQTVVIVLFTILQAGIMPYKSVAINYLDLFFLVDSVLLNITIIYNHKVQVFSNIFLAPVLLVFCLIVAYHIHTTLGEDKLRWLLVKMHLKKSTALSDSNTHGDHEEDEGEIEKTVLIGGPKMPSPNATYSALVVDDPLSVQHYKPEELREPLIESD